MQDLLVRAEPADQKEASNVLIEYILGLYRDDGKEKMETTGMTGII